MGRRLQAADGRILVLFCYFGETSGRTLHDLEKQLDELIAWSDGERELAKSFWSRIVAWVRDAKDDEVQDVLCRFSWPKSKEELESCFEESERRVREWNELVRS